ncbi:MAG: aminopeptidase P family protein, partial [Acidobacteria bacterium]|nr:aminopeptidase P family protein [Acidobacteriota bacterium]
MELERIQQALQQRGIDAWLFYDFQRCDPIAYRVLGLPSRRLATRRWYYLIPARGLPAKLVHRIESAQLDSLPGEKRIYASWEELRKFLGQMLAPFPVLAMQYSPDNSIPYISRVDAGTVEWIRGFGKQVVSSSDLVQLFEARWSPKALQYHLEAGRIVDRIVAATFEEIGRRVRAEGETSEYAIQEFILERLHDSDLATNSKRPIVAVNQNSGNPHYEVSRKASSPIRSRDFVLLDVWAKLKKPEAVFYDITWVGFVGEEPPEKIQRVFEIVKMARDRAVETVQAAVQEGRVLRGWEVDRAARSVIAGHGYADSFIHRTGHSLGESVHGNG